MDQVRDIGVSEKVRRNIKVQSVVDALISPAPLPKLRRDCMMDFLSVDIAVDGSLFCGPNRNVVPDSAKLGIR